MPDPRAENPYRCGVTRKIGGTEWVCVRESHSKVYHTRRGERISDNPSSEQHYFVNKWPHRKREQ